MELESKVLQLEVVLKAGHLLLPELVDVPPEGLFQLKTYSGISFKDRDIEGLPEGILCQKVQIFNWNPVPLLNLPHFI